MGTPWIEHQGRKAHAMMLTTQGGGHIGEDIEKLMRVSSCFLLALGRAGLNGFGAGENVCLIQGVHWCAMGAPGEI